MRDSMLLKTGKLSTGMLASWAITPSFQSCPTNLRGFYMSFMITSLDLPPLPAYRSKFDVHGAINTDQVWILLYQCACI